MSKKLEERLIMLNRDIEGIKMTQTELLEIKTICDKRLG